MPLPYGKALDEWFKFVNIIQYKVEIPSHGQLFMEILQLAWRYVIRPSPPSVLTSEMVELLDIANASDDIIDKLSDKLDTIRSIMYD